MATNMSTSSIFATILVLLVLLSATCSGTGKVEVQGCSPFEYTASWKRACIKAKRYVDWDPPLNPYGSSVEPSSHSAPELPDPGSSTKRRSAEVSRPESKRTKHVLSSRLSEDEFENRYPCCRKACVYTLEELDRFCVSA